jgi:hypothetical protein
MQNEESQGHSPQAVPEPTVSRFLHSAFAFCVRILRPTKQYLGLEDASLSLRLSMTLILRG